MTTPAGIIGIPGRLGLESVATISWNAWPHSSESAERSSLLIDQMALQFEELEASATEDELAAEVAVAKATTVAAFKRQRPERNTFPEHLPRERVVIDPPTACDCCGGKQLRKLGEDVTRTLESIPRQWCWAT